MSDLISRCDRYVSIDFVLNETDEFGYENGILYGLSGNSVPSIDIVRCSECIFDNDYYFKNDVKEHRYEWCYEFCDVDGYCPFGKKRSEREGEQ